MRPPPSAKARPRHEAIMSVVQPLVRPLVGRLLRLRVNPLLIVFFHSLLGFLAAGLIGSSRPLLWIFAALLLQAKTVLDNADGGVARAAGKVTQFGRYFDTGMDFFVNVALFAMLAVHGPALLCLLALALLTLLLSLDFNMERFYRAQRSSDVAEAEHPVGAPESLFAFFQGLYRYVFNPQDRWLERLDHALFRRIAGRPLEVASLDERLAWHDMFATASVVNLGLSTQYVVLGLCLLLGQPFWYVYAVFFMALYALAVQLVRTIRFKRYAQAIGRSLS